MTWARLEVVDERGQPMHDPNTDKPIECVFNLAQLAWWRGLGKYAELRFPGMDPVFVDLRDKRLEMLTGSSGHYASDL